MKKLITIILLSSILSCKSTNENNVENSILIESKVKIEELGKIVDISDGCNRNKFFKVSIDTNIFILFIYANGNGGFPVLVKLK